MPATRRAGAQRGRKLGFKVGAPTLTTYKKLELPDFWHTKSRIALDYNLYL